MRLLGTITLIIGILFGSNYVALIPSAEAATDSAGPFTWTTPTAFMGMFGSFDALPGDAEQPGDVVAAFVSDVATGIPLGCIGGLVITQAHIDNQLYGTLKAYGDDTFSPEKDGALAGDTITFKYYTTNPQYQNNAPDGIFDFDNNPTTTFQATPATQVDLGEVTLPVELSAFNATFNSKTSQVTLKWRTETEIDNLGFNVYRSESRDGKYIKVNPAIIKGAGTDATPHDYQFVDESAVVGKTYFCYLEDVSFTGEKHRSRVIQVTIDKSGKLHVIGFERPTTFALLQNYPNPFNPETWIPFHLAKETNVTIRIYNTMGKLVRTLHLSKRPVGVYYSRTQAAHWDGKDNFGDKVSSGIYFYNLTAGNFSATKKLVILK